MPGSRLGVFKRPVSVRSPHENSGLTRVPEYRRFGHSLKPNPMRRNFFSLLVPLLCPALLLAQVETEPNDNFAQANTLTLGIARTANIGGAPCASTSDDYFSLTLVNDGTINITNSVSATGAGTLRVYTYNSGGGQLFSDDFSTGAGGAVNSSTATRTCLGKGTYYFLVQRLTGDCYNYALTVTYAAPVYADDLEPNNDFTQASANPLLAANATTAGHLNFSYQGSDNDDRYKIQTAQDGTLNVTISAENPNVAGAVRVYIYNSGGGQIASFDGVAGGGSVPVSTTSSFTCYGQDSYYFLVTSIGGCGISYQLSYALSAPFYANDVESNNTFGTAIALAHNTFSEGRLNFANAGDNDDRYAVNTPAEGTMTVTLLAENAAGGTVRVYVYNGGGGQIDSFDATIGAGGSPATSSASFTCYGQGAYYFLVTSVGGCGISYKLKYQTTGAVYANDVEPNNTFPDAVTNGVLAHNTFTEGHISFNHYGDNDDRYYVQTPAEGTMTVTLIAERVPAAAGTVRVYIYNGGGGQIDSFDASAGGSNDDDTTSASFTCYGQGDYYFLVTSVGGCGISYKLKYQTTGAVYANDMEPNNTFPQAIANGVVAPNIYTQGHINFAHYGDNDDRYAIQTAGDGTVNFTLIAERVPAAAGTVRVYIYNSGGGQINSFDASAGGSNDDDTTNASFTCYGADTYYLLVTSVGGCGISYKLGYTLTPAVHGNDVGVNNSFPAAVQLNPDSASATGHVNFANIGDDNDDRYRVVLPAAGNIGFDFLAENATGGTVRIYLYNSGGGQINSQDVTVGANHASVTTPVSFPSLAAGTYYMLVTSVGGCGISYRFNCNDADGDGTCNYFDLCPGGPEPGTACNDNSACTINDVIQGNCICAGTFQDTDNDGICNANDNCPNVAGVVGSSCNDNNACTINDVLLANCTCAGTFQDSDNDGICNANDNCPNLAGVQGDPCNDGNASTINDVITPGCVCAGTLLGSDCLGVPGGTALPGTACNDGNACTINDTWSNACVCVGTAVVCNDNNPCTSDACNGLNGQCVFTPLPDGDNDGTCDAQDGCPTDPNKIAPGNCGCNNPEPGTACNDNDPCTINDVITAGCGCAGTLQDSDSDGICDANDNCPNNPGQIGSACNDGNPGTINDVLDANCVCMGTNVGGCNQNLTLSIKLDGNPAQTTWRLYDASETTIVLQGGPFLAGQANTTVNVPICVAQGCYHLRVYDSANNGIALGGYTLKDALNRRIIDASLGTFSGLSEIDNIPANRSFCVPIGNLGMQTATSCDKVRPRTSPIYASTQPGATGYQFWIYDPHGTYNRRVLKPTNLLVPSSLVTNPVPSNLDLNVRVRSLIGLVYSEFGPACRIRFTGGVNASVSEGHSREMDLVLPSDVSLSIFPNPNHDGRVTLAMSDLELVDDMPVEIDVYDMTGQRIYTDRAVVVEGALSHVMDLGARISVGIYTVNVTVGDMRYTKRLVME
jgi:Thrombospondin type 3 repeat